MTYNCQITDYFRKRLKKLIKKDPGLKENLIETLNNFKKEESIALGGGIYKLRMKRDGGGKSGGFRLLVLVEENTKQLAPIIIYPKSARQNLTHKEINHHLENIKAELSLYT